MNLSQSRPHLFVLALVVLQGGQVSEIALQSLYALLVLPLQLRLFLTLLLQVVYVLVPAAYLQENIISRMRTCLEVNKQQLRERKQKNEEQILHENINTMPNVFDFLHEDVYESILRLKVICSSCGRVSLVVLSFYQLSLQRKV